MDITLQSYNLTFSQSWNPTRLQSHKALATFFPKKVARPIDTWSVDVGVHERAPTQQYVSPLFVGKGWRCTLRELASEYGNVYSQGLLWPLWHCLYFRNSVNWGTSSMEKVIKAYKKNTEQQGWQARVNPFRVVLESLDLWIFVCAPQRGQHIEDLCVKSGHLIERKRIYLYIYIYIYIYILSSFTRSGFRWFRYNMV